MHSKDFIIRHPNLKDGIRILELVKNSGSLDKNSTYLYLILVRHFSDTCFVAEQNGDCVGFVSAYLPPSSTDVIFIWQIAVKTSHRGRGLGKAMLGALAELARQKNITYIEASITPDNKASWALFRAFARELNVPGVQEPFFTREMFPSDEHHEEEVLFRMGPLIKNVVLNEGSSHENI